MHVPVMILKSISIFKGGKLLVITKYFLISKTISKLREKVLKFLIISTF